jgi:hypothetical protein
VRRTFERQCDDCRFEAGLGVGAYLDGRLRLDDFVIRNSAFVGLQISRGAEVRARDGEMRDNPIGVNLQSAPTELPFLADNVPYEVNGRYLDASELPVPVAIE